MSMRPERFDKIDTTPKAWHGYSVILFILGSLLPPLAVAARFGIGKDFFTNCVCTICGYFPGHIHNFYIQNIRNNKNSRRTPKWAVRYGLIDDTALKRRAKRSQWATRYDERLPQSALDGATVEDGQNPDRPEDITPRATRSENELWNARQDEGFYNQQNASESQATPESGSGRWHYPANFDDAEPSTPVKTKSRFGKKKDKKDRWARTDDAHSAPVKKKKKSKSLRSSTGEEPWRDEDSGVHDGPEDAVGGLYGPSRSAQAPSEARRAEEETALSHQF